MCQPLVGEVGGFAGRGRSLPAPCLGRPNNAPNNLGGSAAAAGQFLTALTAKLYVMNACAGLADRGDSFPVRVIRARWPLRPALIPHKHEPINAARPATAGDGQNRQLQTARSFAIVFSGRLVAGIDQCTSGADRRAGYGSMHAPPVLGSGGEAVRFAQARLISPPRSATGRGISPTCELCCAVSGLFLVETVRWRTAAS